MLGNCSTNELNPQLNNFACLYMVYGVRMGTVTVCTCGGQRLILTSLRQGLSLSLKHTDCRDWLARQPSKKRLTFYIYLFILCVCTTALMRKSEVNLQELVLSPT